VPLPEDENIEEIKTAGVIADEINEAAAATTAAESKFQQFKEKYISEKEVKIVGLEIKNEEKQTEKKKITARISDDGGQLYFDVIPEEKESTSPKKKKSGKIKQHNEMDLFPARSSTLPGLRGVTPRRVWHTSERILKEPVVTSTTENPSAFFYYPVMPGLMTSVHLGVNITNDKVMPSQKHSPFYEETYVKSKIELGDTYSKSRGQERNVILIRDQPVFVKRTNKNLGKQVREYECDVPGPRIQYDSRGFGGVLGMQKRIVPPAALVKRLSMF